VRADGSVATDPEHVIPLWGADPGFSVPRPEVSGVRHPVVVVDVVVVVVVLGSPL
jgi:hypothetical protein